jgi:hypothetical protein
MKGRRKQVLMLFSLFIGVAASSQNFKKTDIDSVQWKIYDYLQSHQKGSYDSVKSEVLLVILETDVDSRVSKIHLLVDESNKGPAYDMLSKMTVADLKGWNPEHFKNKSIMVPVYSRGIHAETTYADNSFWQTSWSGAAGYIVNKDQKYSVMLSGIMYTPPPPPIQEGTISPPPKVGN